MISYLEFILVTSYMAITYHIIALKYKKSRSFPYFSRTSRTFLVSIHAFIVITNILLYFWLISKDFNPISIVVSALGIVLFTAGLFIIYWGSYSLRKAVLIPENKLVTTGAFGLVFFAGSVLGFIYSFISDRNMSSARRLFL